MSLKQSLDVVDDETTVIQYPYKVLADFLFPSPFTLLLNVDENMMIRLSANAAQQRKYRT